MCEKQGTETTFLKVRDVLGFTHVSKLEMGVVVSASSAKKCAIQGSRR